MIACKAVLTTLLPIFAASPLAESFSSPWPYHFTHNAAKTSSARIIGLQFESVPRERLRGRSMLSSSDVEEDENEEDRKKAIREEIFWAKQRALAAEMTAKSDAALKR